MGGNMDIERTRPRMRAPPRTLSLASAKAQEEPRATERMVVDEAIMALFRMILPKGCSRNRVVYWARVGRPGRSGGSLVSSWSGFRLVTSCHSRGAVQ